MASGADGVPGTAAGRPAGAAPRAARLRPTVLVCGKCLKRCHGGKALRRALKDGAKVRAAEIGARKVRVVETRCLGLCPKGALVAASAATLARGEAVLLREIDEIAAALPRLLPGGGPDA